MDSFIKGPSVVALGFFDGVHPGHKLILSKTSEIAQEYSLEPLAFTFSEHPKGAPLLCTLEDRLEIIKSLGLESIVVPFNSDLANMEAEEFFENVLVKRFKAKYLVVGDNYHFGAKARGDVELLRELARKFNVEAVVLPHVYSAELGDISSSHLRQLITSGQLSQAAKIWQRPLTWSGTVIHGRKVGRTLGIPTANIEIPASLVRPPRGVFAARSFVTGIEDLENRPITGMAYWGNRPTFDNGNDLLEVFLLNPPRPIGINELYGCHLKAELWQMVRGQLTFKNSQELVEQIKLDRHNVQAFFTT
ncbi:riboflavin biosynthesis protein RibF [bacterium]|nr:riboflavin biosynthesis protein RibF [bacterium]